MSRAVFPSWRRGRGESYGWGIHRWPAAGLEVFRRLLRGELDALPVQELFQGPIFGLLLVLKQIDRKSTRLNSSHRCISYAVFCLKKKKKKYKITCSH